eukprot:m.182224 g.182224  ORF g.182224 m.182224 type:complete len:497 (+) comp24628_c0_seq1:234-1724(+)
MTPVTVPKVGCGADSGAMPKFRDYSLTGPEGKRAIAKGLVSAQWFVPQIDRKTLRRLMQRDDTHALRDTAILFGAIAVTATGSYVAWGAGFGKLATVLFWMYCTLYTSSADSRWHECGHGTAFKTKWMNDVLYELASFMVFRLPDVWRFSHARHHTDTDIVGRDPEADARPLSMYNLALAFFNVQGIRGESAKLWAHACGDVTPAERTYVPKSEHPVAVRKARIWLAIYAAVVLLSVWWWTPAPAMYVFLPYTLGAWHFVLVGVFQHASLAQDVLDHRLNTRTCYINPISAFIYWNMHYHVEHHLFPMVPYYNLPELHQVLKPQLPTPYASMWEVYSEMIPALIRQAADPDYFTPRAVPPTLAPPPFEATTTSMTPDKDGWVAACATDEVPAGDLLRFDVGARSFCVYHAEDDGRFYATAGMCTHGAASLADGILLGNLVECPKHNGCFDFKTGEPKRLPVKRRLTTYPVKIETVFGVDQVCVQIGKGGRPIAYDE